MAYNSFCSRFFLSTIFLAANGLSGMKGGFVFKLRKTGELVWDIKGTPCKVRGGFSETRLGDLLASNEAQICWHGLHRV